MFVFVMALLPFLFLFFNHSTMAITDWITALSMLILAIMAVITVNGTYNFLPWPRRRPPPPPPPPPRPLDELRRLSEMVQALDERMDAVIDILDLIIDAVG